MEWGYVSALIAGLTIEAFFKLVKYRDSLNRQGPVSKYEPVNYASVTQYLSGGDRKWVKYIGFRILPPFIILLLLVSVLQAYFTNTIVWIAVIIAILTSILFRDLKLLVSKERMISEKLVHIMNILLIVLAGISVLMIDAGNNISWLAPSLEGVVDNIWSSLLVAMLVVLYFDATDMSNRASEDYAEETAKNNYILKSYNIIQMKYGKEMFGAAIKHQTSLPLLYSIVIYEDMNRPVILRKLENIIVKFFKLELSVGIAQVKSNRPLSDKESIYLAAKMLKNTKSIKNSADILNKNSVINAITNYNPSPIYLQSIAVIMNTLYSYAFELFTENEQESD